MHAEEESHKHSSGAKYPKRVGDEPVHGVNSGVAQARGRDYEGSAAAELVISW
jgi:hypothetical protein